METINSQLPFDPFAIPYGVADPTFASDFSPISPFSPLEDFSTDFASDSAGSPASPVSPGLSASSYGLPTGDEWTSWDSIEHSPEPDFSFEGSLFAPFPSQKPAMSPAVNPMDLTIPSGMQGLGSQQPLFQPPQFPSSTLPASQSQKLSATIPSAPANREDASARRYPSRNNLKRKSSSASEEEESSPNKRSSQSPSSSPIIKAEKIEDKEGQVPKKTAHNMIEKRYRTNLNDKIAQLRDAVPALRVVAQRFEHGDDGEEGFMEDEYAGLAPVPKLNKATILSKATEYIMQLERRNRSLETENNALRGRMEGLEMLLMSRGGQQAVWN